MIQRKPEGYKNLLAYQKAQKLQADTLALVALFPKTKTFIDLADSPRCSYGEAGQMSRSARSVTKNIVEGWKRNTTKEYIDFLGFSIGSNSELMEDAADVATGVYRELTEIKGVTLQLRSGQVGEKGEMGGKGEMGRGAMSAAVTRERLDKIPFYPLDSQHAPITKLFLEAKEVNFLLARLQHSLDDKMDVEKTRPRQGKHQRALAGREKEEKAENILLETYMRENGLVRLPDGRVVKNEEKDAKSQ